MFYNVGKVKSQWQSSEVLQIGSCDNGSQICESDETIRTNEPCSVFTTASFVGYEERNTGRDTIRGSKRQRQKTACEIITVDKKEMNGLIHTYICCLAMKATQYSAADVDGDERTFQHAVSMRNLLLWQWVDTESCSHDLDFLSQSNFLS